MIHAVRFLAASNESGDNRIVTKKILVTGATGTIGRQVTKHLAAHGASTRAAVRDRTKARKQFGNEIELATFTFEDKRLIADALEDVEKIFLLPPLMPNQIEVTNAFVDAAQKAGVQHIVKLSAIGVGSEAFTVGEWHAANESHIRDSGLAFTFLRPNSFMQNFINYFPPRNCVIHLPWGKGKASFVDARDIASVAVRALTTEAHKNKVYTLTGPAALSIDEVARTLSHAADREIKYVDVPESVVRQTMLNTGMAEWQVDSLMELHAINKESRWSTITPDVQEVTGKPPMDFREFARDHADNFR
jgi:uncharacterized protein YbjT (DUF2867 family)